MSDFVLSCCSVVDLNPEYMQKRNIHFACFHFTMDGEECVDDMGQTMTHSDFYKAMENGADVHTSQVNVEEYTRYFGNFLSQGLDVLHVTLSSGLSGSYNSARIAAELLQVGGLHITQHLQTHGFKVIKKSSQLETGTAHIIHSNPNLFKIRCLIQGIQIKFRNQISQ